MITAEDYIKALLSNDAKKVKSYLQEKGRTPYLDEVIHPLCALTPAAAVKVATQLLEHGTIKFNIDKPDASGLSPLWVAIKRGQADLVKLLLENNANPNLLTQERETPLHFALKQGYREIAHHLSNKSNIKKTINAVNKQGQTAILLAVEQGYPEVVKALLEQGADPLIKDQTIYQNDAFTAAIRRNDIPMLEILLSRKERPDYERLKSKALCTACLEGNYAIAKLLIEKYDTQNLPDEAGYLPLQRAQISGNTELVQYLKSKFGSDAAKREKLAIAEPIESGFTQKGQAETQTFIERCKTVRKYGQLLGLRTTVPVPLPYSKEKTFLKTAGSMPLESVIFLKEAIDSYLTKTNLDSRTEEHFKRILQSLNYTVNYLKMDGRTSASDLLQLHQRNEVVFVLAAWFNHCVILVLNKNFLAYCNGNQGIMDTGVQIFNLSQTLNAQYIQEVLAFGSRATLGRQTDRIIGIFNPNQAFDRIKAETYSSGNPAIANLEAGILGALQTFKLLELLEDYNSGNLEKLRLLEARGVSSIASLKILARRDALKKFKNMRFHFIKSAVLELRNLYLNKNLNEEDRELYKNLLLGFLADYHGQRKNSSPRMKKFEIDLGLKILKVFTPELRLQIIQDFNVKEIDLLKPALEQGCLELEKLLLKNGVNVNITLENAIIDQNKALVDKLLAGNYIQNINQLNAKGLSPLHLAVMSGNIEITTQLLKMGANPNLHTRENNTAFTLAAAGSNAEMMKLLSLFEHTGKLPALPQFKTQARKSRVKIALDPDSLEPDISLKTSPDISLNSPDLSLKPPKQASAKAKK